MVKDLAGHKKRRGLNIGVFDVVNTIIMIIIAIVMIYPFWNTIAVSFNDAQDSLRGGITLSPRVFSTYSYQQILTSRLMVTATVNSVLRTVLATVLGVFVSALIAYVLSRKELVGRKFITVYFLVTMYVSAGLIPTYFLMKDLKLLNNFWVYILPNLISVYNVIVIKSFMQALPESLSEAAIVDGAGHFRTFVQIIIPCSKPVLATIALWCAVGAWNAWFDTFLYNSSKDELTTLQYEMMKLLSSAMNQGKQQSLSDSSNTMANTVTPTSMRAAVTVVASVPILVVYPFLQKYFVKGVTLGAVKG
ncbi:carbohydrate ABC transporter permease [Scatolibacter rhodanostii]|uniref:carbohydrate ABC transporter permease n=1 Tax=Scatolibacter rhodanostii TaxID=2014781 RepID=UPI000C07DD86|nr:carbohydrate ABC transporter permease [Scatolibacter rhodanostii]